MTETKYANQFSLTARRLKELRKETFSQRGWQGGEIKKKKEKKSDWYKRTHGAEIKMFHIEQREMNWARPEEKGEENQWASDCGERDGITNGICQWGTAAAK